MVKLVSGFLNQGTLFFFQFYP